MQVLNYFYQCYEGFSQRAYIAGCELVTGVQNISNCCLSYIQSFADNFSTDYSYRLEDAALLILSPVNSITNVALDAISELPYLFDEKKKQLEAAIVAGDEGTAMDILDNYPVSDPLRWRLLKKAYTNNLVDLSVRLYENEPLEEESLIELLESNENADTEIAFALKAIPEERGNILLTFSYEGNEKLFQEYLAMGITQESCKELCTRSLQKKEELDLFKLLYHPESFSDEESAQMIREVIINSSLEEKCQIVDFLVENNYNQLFKLAVLFLFDSGHLDSRESLLIMADVLIKQNKEEMVRSLFELIPVMGSDCDLFSKLVSENPKSADLLGELFDEKTRVVAVLSTLSQQAQDGVTHGLFAALATLAHSALLIDSIFKSSLEHEYKCFLLTHPTLQDKALIQRGVFNALKWEDIKIFELTARVCTERGFLEEILEPVLECIKELNRPDLMGSLAHLLVSTSLREKE